MALNDCCVIVIMCDMAVSPDKSRSPNSRPAANRTLAVSASVICCKISGELGLHISPSHFSGTPTYMQKSRSVFVTLKWTSEAVSQ